MSESDQRAASTLTARMPSRPADRPSAAGRPTPISSWPPASRPDRRRSVPPGDFLPGQKVLAAEHGVSVGTANRAANLLAEDGYVELVPGRGFRVMDRVMSCRSRCERAGVVETKPAGEQRRPSRAVLLDIALRHRGEVVAQFSTAADPRDGTISARFWSMRSAGAGQMRPRSLPTRWTCGWPATVC